MSGRKALIFEFNWSEDFDFKKMLEEIQLLIKNFSLEAFQLIDRESLISPNHLLSACWHALLGKENGRLISKSLSIDIVLYASMQRQIKVAFDVMGIKESTNTVVGIILGSKVTTAVQAFDRFKELYCLKIIFPPIEIQASKLNRITTLLKNIGAKDINIENDLNEIEKEILSHIALLAIE